MQQVQTLLLMPLCNTSYKAVLGKECSDANVAGAQPLQLLAVIHVSMAGTMHSSHHRAQPTTSTPNMAAIAALADTGCRSNK
jgi:hypothetical protein